MACGVGIWLSSQTAPQVASVWAAGLALVAVAWRPRRRAAIAVWLVAVALLGGATRAAVERIGERTGARTGSARPSWPGIDDRAVDEVVGIAVGPIEDGDGVRRFDLEVERIAPGRLRGGGGRGDGSSAGARVRVTARLPRPPVWPGDRVAVRGRLHTPRGYRVPGARDARRAAAAAGYDLALSADGEDVIVVDAAAVWSLWRWPARLQRRAATAIEARGGDADARAVVRAMAVGDRGGLARDVADRFRDAGVAHILAVSGLHLAVVALLAFAAVRRGWAAIPALAARVQPATAAALAAAPVAIGFTLMSGARTSTLRALLVVLIVLAGVATGRRARIIDALGVAALALMLASPQILWDPSFQLSFSASATLALAFGRAGAESLSAVTAGARSSAPRRVAAWLGRWLWTAVRATLWASAATAPFTALAFGRVATGGLVANLVVVPLAELVILPLGLAGAALSAIWPAAGGALLDVAIAAADAVCAVVSAVAARAPVLRVFGPTAVELVALAAIWAAALAAARGRWQWRRAVAVCAVAAAVVAASVWDTTVRAPARRDALTLTFVDVGQGDAAVLELPGGGVWLIDSGGLPFVAADDLSAAERRERAALPGELAVARFLASRRIRRVDVAVLSHPHPDHYEGLRAVARQVEIGALWVAQAPPDVALAPSYTALIDALRAAGTRIVHPRLGRAELGRGVSVTVLGPRYSEIGGDVATDIATDVATIDPVVGLNDSSLALMFEYAGRRALLAGDVELEGEDGLVARARTAGVAGAASLRADIVKVPHHGSRTSSTPPFVGAVAPAWAVISCGVGNRFGHPGRAVVSRWRAAGARVLRTDRHGTIALDIDASGQIRARCYDPDDLCPDRLR